MVEWVERNPRLLRKKFTDRLLKDDNNHEWKRLSMELNEINPLTARDREKWQEVKFVLLLSFSLRFFKRI